MRSATISEREVGSAKVGRRSARPRTDSPRIASAIRLKVLTIGCLAVAACFCFTVALSAQTADSSSANANQSWTATSESQSDTGPTRTSESHTQSGNRTVDNQFIQRRNSDGQYEPYQDIEKETVQVDPNTVRTITRTYGRDANGDKSVMQVVEEEKRTSPAGDSNVVRSTSNADGNGGLQLIQRQIEETKQTSKNVEETKTTLMLPNPNGGLTSALKVQERREKDANGTVESQKTTLIPDGAGNWRVGEIRQATTTQQGENGSVDERVSRPDADGYIRQVSRTVTKDAETAPGEKRDTVETFSVDVPGVAGEAGSPTLIKRAVTDQLTSSNGQQTTVQQVQQSTPGDPSSGLQVTIVNTNIVTSGAAGAKGTQTIQMRDANGNYGSVGVVSVDTTKSDNIHAIQVQIAPSDKPK
jgi:hypothetical protein